MIDWVTAKNHILLILEKMENEVTTSFFSQWDLFEKILGSQHDHKLSNQETFTT